MKDKIRFESLLKELNENKMIQKTGDWAESLPDNIWVENFQNNFHSVINNLDVETHRWCETSISVIIIFDALLGIRHISNTFSEGMDYEDCYHTLEFFPMEKINTPSYQKIKKK